MEGGGSAKFYFFIKEFPHYMAVGFRIWIMTCIGVTNSGRVKGS